MVDFVKLAATSKRLIEANGRVVTFIRESETKADPLKPWEGPADEVSDPPTSVDLSAVFVPPNTVRQFGVTALGQGTEFDDVLAYTEQIAIVFPETNDLRVFTHVLDDVRYGIIGLQVLKPATTQLLAFVAIRR